MIFMLWTEKYRPNEIMGIVGQSAFCEDAFAFCKKNEMPNILIHGPQGTGKTSAAIALGKDILQEAKEKLTTGDSLEEATPEMPLQPVEETPPDTPPMEEPTGLMSRRN